MSAWLAFVCTECKLKIMPSSSSGIFYCSNKSRDRLSIEIKSRNLFIRLARHRRDACVQSHYDASRIIWLYSSPGVVWFWSCVCVCDCNVHAHTVFYKMTVVRKPVLQICGWTLIMGSSWRHFRSYKHSHSSQNINMAYFFDYFNKFLLNIRNNLMSYRMKAIN